MHHTDQGKGTEAHPEGGRQGEHHHGRPVPGCRQELDPGPLQAAQLSGHHGGGQQGADPLGRAEYPEPERRDLEDLLGEHDDLLHDGLTGRGDEGDGDDGRPNPRSVQHVPDRLAVVGDHRRTPMPSNPGGGPSTEQGRRIDPCEGHQDRPVEHRREGERPAWPESADQQAAQGRSEGASRVELGRVHGDGVSEVLTWHALGDERLPGGQLYAVYEPADQQQHHPEADVVDPGRPGKGHTGGQRAAETVGGQKHLAPVEVVRHVAGHRIGEQHRDEREEAGHADPCRRTGDPVNDVVGGDVLHPAAVVGQHPAYPEPPVVREAHGREPPSVRRRQARGNRPTRFPHCHRATLTPDSGRPPSG